MGSGHYTHVGRCTRTWRTLSAIALFVALAPLPAAAQTDADLASASPFASDGWNLELSGQLLFEAWDLNITKERLLGGTVAIGRPLNDALAVSGQLSFLEVSQAGQDAFLSTLTGLLQWRVHERGRFGMSLEIGPGVSLATREVPPTGTRFNIVFQTGGGIAYRVSPRASMVGGLRWIHLSNNGMFGRHLNPDVQAVGMYLGWVFD